MATEPDLSALLPASPPPRPDRREAAIGAALRRFDGDAPAVRANAPARRWRLAGRPQLGALAAAALVAAIGLPLWLSGEQRAPMPAQPTAMVAPSRPETSAPLADVAAEPPQEDAALAPPGIVAKPAPPATMPAGQVERSAGALFEPALAPPPAALVAAPPPPPPPPAPAMAAAEEANDARDIVVTGSRVLGRAAKAEQRRERRLAAPGDWNACTVDDPRQNLAACRKAAPVGEGLTRAWRGDLDGAIAAFDRVIAVSPKSASAWLNRGIAHAQAGDDAQALADLDKAVRYAPNDPRGWFQRSLVLRRQGKTARADADAARAAELDPRYEDVLE